MYTIVAIVILFVIAQSIYFLVKALKQAKKLGIAQKLINSTMISSAMFTVAPAVAILIGVIALSQALGFPLPWLRLSVIGSITYETVAANAAVTAVGRDLGGTLITDARMFSTIAWVMTLGIMIGVILVPLVGKKIEGGMSKLALKDKKWGDLFMTGLFLGMISAFLGLIFNDVRMGLSGWIPVFVMASSAILMLICGALHKATKARWITDYALPASMIGGMALSIPITNLVNSLV